jgi:uncharacterized membrane protein YidH (DUF202 family)
MNSPQEYLANERTFLAWLRTCIAIIGLGFVVARFGLFLREFGITVKNGTLTDLSLCLLLPWSSVGVSGNRICNLCFKELFTCQPGY